VFRFRRDVPLHLRDILRQKVFTESLDTKNEADAFRLGLAVVARTRSSLTMPRRFTGSARAGSQLRWR
jgi:hypothetical protein